MKYVVLHGDIAATFDTESSTARGFLAAASKAVADACGCDPCHGEDLLSTLDSDEELEAVYEQFMELLFSDEEE